MYNAPSTLCRINLKTQQSPIILNLCLRKLYAGKSSGYLYVLKKTIFHNSSVLTKMKSGRFKILVFKKLFRKAPFS